MIGLTEIQKQIALAIKQSEFSQAEIARKLGIRHQQISCYIQGKKMPALDTLANLCVILDLDANEVLCVTDKRN